MQETPNILEVEGLGVIKADVAYGGNFYAIIEPQKNFPGLEHVNPSDILRWSPKVREAFRAKYQFVHPENPAINGLSHVMWTGTPTHKEAHAKNAVFYGDKAIDRSPCGTGTSAKLACLAADGKLQEDSIWHQESILGSVFHASYRFTDAEKHKILPTLRGTAFVNADSQLILNERDPFIWGIR